jgi:hypothetical protein
VVSLKMPKHWEHCALFIILGGGHMTSVYAWGDQTPAAVSLPVHPNSGYGVTACSMSISFAC